MFVASFDKAVMVATRDSIAVGSYIQSDKTITSAVRSTGSPLCLQQVNNYIMINEWEIYQTSFSTEGM